MNQTPFQNASCRQFKGGQVCHIPPLGSLNPILPQSTGRYDVVQRVQRRDILVEMAMFASVHDDSPIYLPPSWSSTVHPEGKNYYYKAGPLRAVTESNLQNAMVAQNIAAWITHVQKCAMDQDITFTDSMELYLQPENNDCNYYIADHATQTIFWLTSDGSDDLGLSPVVSRSHMKLQLQAQYWSHVENFCNHIGGLSLDCLDELIQIFSHGLADNLTSSLSTFPYDAAMTEKFLNLLTSSRSRLHEGYTVALVARLWGLIVYNRYETHFGEEQARLSRDANIFVEATNEIQWTKTPASVLTFRTSETFNKRLDTLFMDQFVFGNDWTAFMKFCMTSWQQSIMASTALLLLHAFCFCLPVSPALAYFSALMASLSIISSTFLIHRHDELIDASASVAHDFLSSMMSYRFKFQATAFVFALPKAFFFHGLLAFFSQLIVIIYQFVPKSIAAGFVAIVGCVFLVLHYATSTTPLRPPSLGAFKFISVKSDREGSNV